MLCGTISKKLATSKVKSRECSKPTSVANEQLFSSAEQLCADPRSSFHGDNAKKWLFLLYNICLFRFSYQQFQVCGLGYQSHLVQCFSHLLCKWHFVKTLIKWSSFLAEHYYVMFTYWHHSSVDHLQHWCTLLRRLNFSAIFDTIL